MNINEYILLSNLIYIVYIYTIYIHILYIYIKWIIEYIHIYSCTIINSCTVNVNLMLIFIELSELIICCKYT